VRTVKNLPVANAINAIEHRGTEHDALDDAVYQARQVAAVLDQQTA